MADWNSSTSKRQIEIDHLQMYQPWVGQQSSMRLTCVSMERPSSTCICVEHHTYAFTIFVVVVVEGPKDRNHDLPFGTEWRVHLCLRS